MNHPGAHAARHLLTPQAPADAPLMVLVHGLEANWQGWAKFAAHHPAGWRMVALDMPWRAGNDYAWTRRGSAGSWLAAAVAGLGEPPRVLVGHSFGANAVLDLLATADPGIDAAALLAPFYRPGSYPVTWELFEHTRKGFDAVVRDGLATWLRRRARAVDQELVDNMLYRVLERIGPLAFTHWFAHFVATADLPLGAVTVPTLVVAGRDDPALDPARASALAAAMPAAEVELHDGLDHFCHIKQAARVAARVGGFLPAATPGTARGECRMTERSELTTSPVPSGGHGGTDRREVRA